MGFRLADVSLDSECPGYDDLDNSLLRELSAYSPAGGVRRAGFTETVSCCSSSPS